jgi:hypothetical protein
MNNQHNHQPGATASASIAFDMLWQFSGEVHEETEVILNEL